MQVAKAFAGPEGGALHALEPQARGFLSHRIHEYLMSIINEFQIQNDLLSHYIPCPLQQRAALDRPAHQVNTSRMMRAQAPSGAATQGAD
jgi:hypothetical protein